MEGDFPPNEVNDEELKATKVDITNQNLNVVPRESKMGVEEAVQSTKQKFEHFMVIFSRVNENELQSFNLEAYLTLRIVKVRIYLDDPF